MTEAVTPADEYERRLEWVHAVAREGVRRWAVRSLLAQAAIPALLSVGCVCSLSLPSTMGTGLEAIWYLVLLFTALAAVFALCSSIGAAVLLVRDWSKLTWKTKLLGIAPWLSVSTICLLLMMALLA
jgi:hypothetical protein